MNRPYDGFSLTTHNFDQHLTIFAFSLKIKDEAIVEMTEAQTIQSAQNGDLAAFNRLVMSYQGLAYNVAYRVMGNADAAADATQDAFVKAFKSIQQYRGGSFKGWLLRIVSNTCYDRLRYDSRRPTEALEPDDGECGDFAPYLLDPAAPPEKKVEQHEMAQMLQNAIDQLPPDQRLILVLNDVEGFSYREIAEATGLALGTVKSRLSRARLKMRHILQRQELLPAQYRL